MENYEQGCEFNALKPLLNMHQKLARYAYKYDLKIYKIYTHFSKICKKII